MRNMLKGLLKSAAFAVTPLLSLVFIFGVSPVYANLYKWMSEDGVLHITDSLGKVPEAQRHKVEVFKLEPQRKRRIEQSPVYIPPTKPMKKPPTLYGDHTIEWWRAAFDKLNEEIETLKDDIENKRQFITVFEGGRRFGQMFGDTEVANYKRYKKEIINDREALKELEDKLEKLRREARIADVPREIIGE